MWLSNPFQNKRKNREIRYAQTNTMFIVFGILLFLARMQTFFMSLNIKLENDYKLTSYLLPIFVYMFCWNLISKLYKSKKYFLITTSIFIIFSLLLSRIQY